MIHTELSEELATEVDRVRRNRAVTLPLLQLFSPDETPDAIRMRYTRLDEAGWVRKFPMGQREHYYALGPLALRHLIARDNRPHRPFRGFGQDGLATHLGIGFLCARFELTRLLEAEFVERFPGHTRVGLPMQNYLVSNDGSNETLYWAQVDLGRDERRLPQRIGRLIAKRFALPAFRARIEAGGFAVAILTGREQRARQIDDALYGKTSRHVKVQAQVVPELLPLLLLGRGRV